MEIPQESLVLLAEVVPHMTYTDYDVDRLLTVIAASELLDLDEPKAA